ncbi:DUF5919 domain-containing protein [Plantactinospora endophytica]|uniref:HTH cro/C1-type domain-containing protein n=1 Tax=Plantactinospora endophytica TaxID=673535 RepID=A0ABQ4DSQ2_9ACTN|nr:DUF5919 domain-containing protein [Plantactinospora endophytica]GIG85481.1 hypothetical protein Pen02_04170 [Plantactinospora endophytica]
MATVQRWTGRETRALRQALRMSIRNFAEHLGVSDRTVSKWEAGQSNVRPRPEMQAALDTALARAETDIQRRFDSITGTSAQVQQPDEQVPANCLAGVTAVYRTRAELMTNLPHEHLLNGARLVRAAGLSLNVLCQHYADHRWRELIQSGTHAQCLFLDPAGSAIQAREAEEGFPAGHLAALTRLNIETMLRIRDRLPEDLQQGVAVGVYDETVRFNIVIVDDLCITQPYLPQSRGVDAPAFVIRRGQPSGLYPVFEQVFTAQWEGSRQL